MAPSKPKQLLPLFFWAFGPPMSSPGPFPSPQCGCPTARRWIFLPFAGPGGAGLCIRGTPHPIYAEDVFPFFFFSLPLWQNTFRAAAPFFFFFFSPLPHSRQKPARCPSLSFPPLIVFFLFPRRPPPPRTTVGVPPPLSAPGREKDADPEFSLGQQEHFFLFFFSFFSFPDAFSLQNR